MLKRLSWLLMAGLLAGCVPLEPYRYTLAPTDTDCSGEASTRPVCTTSARETTPQYDLHFVEFDDQGLQYPESFRGDDWRLSPQDTERPDCDLTQKNCLHRPAWAYQINNLIKQLNVAAADPRNDGITLVVFIHGWKHNASAGDDNVDGFRKLLQTTASIEANRPQIAFASRGKQGPTRRVVGVYVSWRGGSIDVPLLKEATFWSRKTAAMHVAQGSSRELFARLRGFKCVQNAKRDGTGTPACNHPPDRTDKVKIVLVGHSFGGLILYNAISGSLIESMTNAFDAEETAAAPYWRFADLAVLINPAFEATRYAPLQRIAAGAKYERYETPLLVTVTSTTDSATRVFFRLGRAVNTLFEQHADAEEKNANRETIGHHRPFVTHQLAVSPDADAASCSGWRLTPKGAAPAVALADLTVDLPIEYENSKRFFRTHGENFGSDRFRLREDDQPLSRDFCGGVRLTQTGGKRNAPVWNVSAVGNEALLPNHNDIMEPLFVAFFRQLYLDTIFLKDMTEDIQQGR